MKEVDIKLDYFKSTKGTHVYKTEEQGALIKSVYLSREAMPIAPPLDIEITVKYND